MKLAEWRERFLGKEGMEGGPAEARGKERQRSSLAVLEEESASA